MAGRRKVYGGSVSPRYKLKMFDYLSKGGRIPATLVMSAVDQMDEIRARNYGEFQKEYDMVVVRYFEQFNVPNALRGIGRALAFRFKKTCDRFGVTTPDAKGELMTAILEEHGLTGTVVGEALLAYARGEPLESEGEATGGEKSK